jgi:hypothetical protein
LGGLRREGKVLKDLVFGEHLVLCYFPLDIDIYFVFYIQVLATHSSLVLGFFLYQVCCGCILIIHNGLT